MSHSSLGVALLLATLVGSWSGLGAAQPGADPVALYDAAKQHFGAGEYEAALADIERSLQLLDSPNSDLLRAHVLLKLGRTVEAMVAYLRAHDLARKRIDAGESRFEATAAEAKRSAAALRSVLAELEITILGGSTATTVRVGDDVIGLEARAAGDRTARVWRPPGEVSVEAADGAARSSQRAQLAAGGTARITLDLRPQTPTEPQPLPLARSLAPPVASWVLGGVGLAGLTSFAVLGGLALSIDADLASSCSPRCGADREDDAARGERFQIAADVSLGVAAAALVAGAVIWIVSATVGDGAAKPTTALRLQF